jgi:hypothetical protein
VLISVQVLISALFIIAALCIYKYHVSLTYINQFKLIKNVYYANTVSSILCILKGQTPPKKPQIMLVAIPKLLICFVTSPTTLMHNTSVTQHTNILLCFLQVIFISKSHYRSTSNLLHVVNSSQPIITLNVPYIRLILFYCDKKITYVHSTKRNDLQLAWLCLILHMITNDFSIIANYFSVVNIPVPTKHYFIDEYKHRIEIFLNIYFEIFSQILRLILIVIGFFYSE